MVFPEDLDFLQDRFANLDEVNYLAKRMDSFFGDEEYQFYEAMKLEGFDTLPDLINLSFNLNRYPLIRDIGDMGKIGREYLLTVKGCVPAHDEDDPKYAQLGRELIQSGIGSVFAADGTLLHYFSGKFYGNGHTISNLDFSENYGKTEYACHCENAE